MGKDSQNEIELSLKINFRLFKDPASHIVH